VRLCSGGVPRPRLSCDGADDVAGAGRMIGAAGVRLLSR